MKLCPIVLLLAGLFALTYSVQNVNADSALDDINEEPELLDRADKCTVSLKRKCFALVKRETRKCMRHALPIGRTHFKACIDRGTKKDICTKEAKKIYRDKLSRCIVAAVDKSGKCEPCFKQYLKQL